MNQVTVPFIMSAIALALLLAGCRATRSGYESAPYTVVRSEGKFEVRDYPALMVAETPMARGGQDGDGSFNRLFGFITGKNESEQKIAMTTPVLMSGAESNRTMAFVMPAPMKSGAVPRPTDDAVAVRELPAGRFAVLRFSGERSAEREAASLGQLQTWMVSQGLQVKSLPVYGYFDPPWTPSPLRRNEVMLQTDSGT